MDVLTLWKIKRITIARRLGVEPAYLDSAGDAPDFGDIDLRKYEINDIMQIMNAAFDVFRIHGIIVFPDWNMK